MSTIILSQTDHDDWIDCPDSEHWEKRMRAIMADAQEQADTLDETVEIHDRNGCVLEAVTPRGPNDRY